MDNQTFESVPSKQEEASFLYKDIDRVSKEILRQSTPAGWREYFLRKAKGDKELAVALEAQLLDDIRDSKN